MLGGVFIAGGIAHLILGRLYPEGYAVFAVPALLDWMKTAWISFPLPRIGWLPFLLATYEITVGFRVLANGRARCASAPQ